MRLKEYLEQEGKTQTFFAKKLGVHIRTVANIVAGNTASLPIARKIVALTNGNVTYEDLIHSDDLEENPRKQSCKTGLTNTAKGSNRKKAPSENN